MGFEPVINDEDECSDKLIEYMVNDCGMEEVYNQRGDSFFKYHDRSNSKDVMAGLYAIKIRS